MKSKLLILFLILVLASVLRIYKLADVPLGFHQDEASQAYNSFSILTTARDRYGQFLPILSRTFGSYQPTVYTYFTAISIFLFGNTIFAARFASSVFGVLIVAITYLIVDEISGKKYKNNLALLASFIVAISPWAIHFSRRVIEGNLGLFFFLLAFYFFLISLKKIKYILPACLFLGISTHAYYSERLISVIFLPVFLIYFRDYYLKYIKWVIYGLIVLAITFLPHLLTIVSGAFANRFNQVGSSGDGLFILAFLKHFVGYFSPRYLFSDTGDGLARVSPNLAVFYDWFFVPFLAGLYLFFKMIDKRFIKFMGLLTIIVLVPVSLTGDVFYPLRALEFFWILSLVISIGILEIGDIIKHKAVKWIIFSILVIYSLGSFYVSYFILFQNETAEFLGRSYISLSQELEKYNDYKIVLDSPRDPGVGLRLAYFRKYDPRVVQSDLRSQLTAPYYSREVNDKEVYIIDNIEIRPIEWGKDRCSPKTILVGDKLTFSEPQILEHNLSRVFEIFGSHKDVVFQGFKTNPDKGCN